jgi:hypothetical protein
VAGSGACQEDATIRRHLWQFVQRDDPDSPMVRVVDRVALGGWDGCRAPCPAVQRAQTLFVTAYAGHQVAASGAARTKRDMRLSRR